MPGERGRTPQPCQANVSEERACTSGKSVTHARLLSALGHSIWYTWLIGYRRSGHRRRLPRSAPAAPIVAPGAASGPSPPPASPLNSMVHLDVSWSQHSTHCSGVVRNDLFNVAQDNKARYQHSTSTNHQLYHMRPKRTVSAY